VLSALPLHLLREIFFVVFIAVPTVGVAGALVTFARRRGPAPQPIAALAPANGRGTTRGGFLRYGAAGVTTLAGASLGGSRLLEAAGAAEDPCVVYLTINEGYVPMVDGTPVFMRGFGYRDAGGPLVPGPPLAHAGSVGYGELLTLKEDDCLKVVIKNALSETHRFAILDPLNDFISGEVETDGVTTTVSILEIPAKAQRTITYTVPRAGTYIYQDTGPAQSLLGLHGTMVVMPKDGTKRPYGDDRTANPPPDPDLPRLPEPPTFQFQYVWVLHDVDPLWGEHARLGTLTDPTGALLPTVPPFFPRYFTINGGSGGDGPNDSTENKRTHIERDLDQATLIRIANCGAAVHSCHFHGNHVFVVTDNHAAPFNIPFPIAIEKDVLRMTALTIKDMLLPCHKPLDQYPPYDPATAYLNDYPMHCHAEMSQTAAGGNYPSGMLTDWSLEANGRGRRPLDS
jgi:hypothetical protein